MSRKKFVGRRPTWMRTLDPRQADTHLRRAIQSMQTHLLRPSPDSGRGFNSGSNSTKRPNDTYLWDCRIRRKLSLSSRSGHERHTTVSEQSSSSNTHPTAPSTLRERPMDGFAAISVRRKISDTLCGEILECELPQTTMDPGNARLDTVAVKVVSLALANKLQRGAVDRTVDNPVHEVAVARLLSTCPQHPHVVSQIDQICSEDTIFIVTEYCDGGDLYSHLDAQRPHRLLAEHQAAGFMRQIVKGVRFLHETAGIAHRDLSLENILLTADGVCKITDFALSVDTRQVCHDRAGKDMYMAPEVVTRRSYDPAKADIWSLGIMWFILLTGSPFVPLACPSHAALQLVEKHGVGIVLKKWGLDDRVSPATVELLNAMLQVNPQRRPSLQFVLDHPALARQSPTCS